MALNPKRLLLILEILLIAGAVLFLTHHFEFRISPLTSADQSRVWKKPNPQEQIQEYYRRYPESYIRISKETWQFDEQTRTAFHTFTLKNTAAVSYTAIEIRFAYESSSRKTLLTRVIKIPGRLPAWGTLEVKKVQVKDLPATAANALMSVAGAKVY